MQGEAESGLTRVLVQQAARQQYPPTHLRKRGKTGKGDGSSGSGSSRDANNAPQPGGRAKVGLPPELLALIVVAVMMAILGCILLVLYLRQ